MMTEEISRKVMEEHGASELDKRVLFELMKQNPHMVDEIGRKTFPDHNSQGPGYCEPARYL